MWGEVSGGCITDRHTMLRLTAMRTSNLTSCNNVTQVNIHETVNLDVVDKDIFVPDRKI
jgi:hypothetical protein